MYRFKKYIPYLGIFSLVVVISILWIPYETAGFWQDDSLNRYVSDYAHQLGLSYWEITKNIVILWMYDNARFLLFTQYFI